MWYRAYYHFSRPHESLRLTYTNTNAKGEEVVRYRNRTPAMAAGLTRRRFTCQGVAATSPASSGLTRSGAKKATERGWHDPIPLS